MSFTHTRGLSTELALRVLMHVLPQLRSLLLAALLATTACFSDNFAEPTPISDLPDAAQVRDARDRSQDSAKVSGEALTLEAGSWRDGMPGAGDSGLMVSVRLAAKDGRAMPRDIKLVRAYVLNRDLAWSVDLTNEARSNGPTGLESVGREGPDWRAGTLVDVVVRVDSATGSVYLANRGVRIELPM